MPKMGVPTPPVPGPTFGPTQQVTGSFLGLKLAAYRDEILAMVEWDQSINLLVEEG